VQRQSAAILFGDVAGYSRLMDLYEAATYARIRALFAEVIEPTVTARAGWVVKNTGDGFLASFADVASAIQAAIDIQREVRRQEAARPPEHQIAFRMGLHWAEIVVEDHDVYGAGVNVAARLEELSEPGGLLISGAARDQIGRDSSLPLADLGDVELKNIASAVRVFAVGTTIEGGPPSPRAMPRSRIGIPSIAVLPFVEYGAGPDQSYFGDGLVEDIVGALQTLPDFHVISRNSTLKYRGSQPDLRSVASELGVRYVLTGNVRRRDDRLRISAELADVETLQAIGSYHGEDAATELFALQDRLTERVVQSLTPNIRTAELRRIRRKRPENLDTYEYFLRGLDLLYRLDRDGFEQARRMFEEAIRRDPDYAPPYAFAAQWHSLRANQGWSPDRKADLAKVNEFASAALLRDPNNVWALALSGHLRAVLFRDFATAFGLFDRALHASPNCAFAWSRSSPAYSYVGDAAEARRRAEHALRLSPFEPDIFFTHCALGFAAYTEGDFESAIAWARRSYAGNPVYTANLRFLAASLAALGETEEARRISDDLLRVEPRFSVAKFIEGYAYRDAGLRNRFARHLYLAGLPE
jgi:TolB-like protein/class 3 adenylate cyclase/Tfp pilus assembly protein PilF